MLFANLSISKRLTLGTFLITFFTLLTAIAILSQFNAKNLQKEYSSQIKSYMIELADLTEEISYETSAYDNKIIQRWMHSEFTNEHYEAVILSKNGEVLTGGKTFPMSIEQFNKELPDNGIRFWKNEQGKQYILGKSNGVIIVARDLQSENRKERKLLIISVILCFIASLVIAILSFAASKTVLFPIAKMNSLIGSIGAKDLHKRLNSDDFPDELKPIATAFDAMLERLENNFERLNRFSSDLAHELRTPIHRIKIAAEITLSKERQQKEYIESLEETLENAQSLNKIIEDMLFIARADNNNTALKKERVNMATTAKKLKDFFQILLDEKNASLDIDGACGILNADAKMLSRALINLISNALRHIGQNGHIKLSSKVENGIFLIQIENNGEPIALKHIDNIFDRFYKTNFSRTDEEYAGNGLGLAIVRSIVELHNGSITAQNFPDNKGAKFIISIPI